MLRDIINMKITRLQLGGVSLYTIIICFFSYLVATRDYSIGTDTLNYYQYFLNVDFYNGSQYQHEMGFHYLVLIVYKLTKSYTFFLFVFNILINIFYIKSRTNFIDIIYQHLHLSSKSSSTDYCNFFHIISFYYL